MSRWKAVSRRIFLEIQRINEVYKGEVAKPFYFISLVERIER